MATELNIVDLIENNPIIKLSDTYNIRLLEKIKLSFSDKEQQLFITSFYCYLNYDKEKDFVVDMDNVWKWLGFSTKQNTLRVLEKHFKINVDYIESSLINFDKRFNTNTIEQKQHEKGGQNKQIIMLTIKCFKSLCLKAQTKKAAEIHEYYIKLEELLHEVIEEEATEFKKQLQLKVSELTQKSLELDQKTEELDQKINEIKNVSEQEKHKLIMKQYGIINGSLVYIVRIKTLEDGSYIIKIGESRKGVRNRYNEFKQKYGNHIVFLDVFLVTNSSGFEKFLHNHKLIRPNKVTNLKDHEKENELFLIGHNLSYRTLLDIIETNQSQFDYNSTDYENLKLENEKLKLECNMLQSNHKLSVDDTTLKELLHTNKLLLNRITDLETSNKEILSKLNTLQTKTTTKFNEPDPHIGPRLQKINPEKLDQIVKVYETVTECIKEDPKIKRPSLNKAVKENTIYCGFRWLLVDRSLDPYIIHSIEPTKVTRIQNMGYIAKLNKDKSEIIQVYLDRKTASNVNGYKSSSALDNIVKNNTLKDNYYYQLFDNCEDKLKNNFYKKNGNVILYKDGVGQYDSNNNLLQEFICKDDCVKKISISQKSLAKVLDKNITYNNCYFKSLGSKLYM